MKYVVLLLSLLFVAARPGGAVEPATQEAIVLRNKVFDGFEYKDNFVPSNTDEFLLLANHDNAVAIVQTLEYYWPLSRQIYMAPDKLNISLDGELRVFQSDKLVAKLTREQFVVVYPEGLRGGSPSMIWGGVASLKAAEFKQLQRDYAAAVARAQSDKSRYDDELFASAANRARGLPAEAVKAPLPMPPEPKLLVTELSDGYRINLPPGQYELALFDGDREWIGSRRTLTVLPVAPTSRLTLDIVPEERWTRLLPLNTLEDAAFAKPGSTLYVVAQWSDAFDDDTYARLTAPQLNGIKGQLTWIRRKPADGLILEYSADGSKWNSVSPGQYAIRQTGGASLGYRIEQAKAGETPDLSAFVIQLPQETSFKSFQLRMREMTTGELLSESQRTVHLVRPVSVFLLWGLAMLPVALGTLLLFVLWRWMPLVQSG